MSQQINLYNPIFLKQEKLFSSRTMAQALGLIALGLFALYVYALVQTRSAEKLAAQYRAQVAAQRDQLVRLGPKFSPEARSRALEAEVARLQSEVKARESVLGALGTGALGNTTGFSGFMAALGRQAIPGVWLTGVAIGESGDDLQVHGRALRPELVPSYLKALSGEAMMRGRHVTELKVAAKQEEAKDGGRVPARFVEFTLSAPRGGLEAPPADPAGKAAR